MPISSFPPAPSRSDPTTFADKGDAYLAHLESPFVAEANALEANVNAKELSANTAATNAAASANAASATANVTAWNGSTVYSIGANVWDTTNFLTYRRRTTGASATRPGLDSTNWALISGQGDASLGGTQTFSGQNIFTGLDNTFTQSLGITEINRGPVAGFRNLIINGNFLINQRGYVSGTPTTVNRQYTLDRWCVLVSGQTLEYEVSPHGKYVLAPVGGIEQVIEEFSQPGGVHTISWQGSATCTVNGTAVANGGQVSLSDLSSTTVRFFNGTVWEVQLENGSIATPFERRPIALQQALCERYFQLVDVEFSGYSLLNNTVSLGFSFPSMRAAPTQTLNGSMGTSGVGTPIVAITKPHYGVISATKTGANGYFLIQRPMLLSAEL